MINRKSLIYFCVLILAACDTDKSYACCEAPTASMSPTQNPICVGCTVAFNATASYDPDCCGCSVCKGVSMINGIRKFQWDWTNDGTYDYAEEPGDGIASYSFSSAGYYTVGLKVYDDDNACCCSGEGCNDQNDTFTTIVLIVKVDKVVECGTNNEGPIYVCPNASVCLEAKSYPAGAPFPTGEPHWTIESQPTGANASLYPTSGSRTTTLSGLTKLGNYVVRAKCGSSDAGDTITVSTPSTSGLWENWIPFTDCPPENWSFIEDDCSNWLSVYCDSTNHLSELAFSWWHTRGAPPWVNRGTEVGCCVWNGGYNLAKYKYSFPGKKLYLETMQMSCNNYKGVWDPHGEGCTWYYCYRYVTFDCVTDGATPSINWYRDADLCPCLAGWPDTSTANICPGTGGTHPGYKN